MPGRFAGKVDSLKADFRRSNPRGCLLAEHIGLGPEFVHVKLTQGEAGMKDTSTRQLRDQRKQVEGEKKQIPGCAKVRTNTSHRC